MKPPSVAMMKGIRGEKNRRDIPLEGTKLRQLYDLFANSPAKPVQIYDLFSKSSDASRPIDQLRDFYGLDIRVYKKGSRGHRSLWWLVGAYNDKGEYVDYVLERFNKGS